MSKVYCSNCGAEIVLPEKSKLITGLTVSEETKGTYMLPTKENMNMRFKNESRNFTSETKQNVTIKNKTEDNNNGGNNMNNFSMEELVTTVATVMGQMNGNQATLMSTATETKEKQVEYWAKNSKFYGKVMSDGHVFNPYLDRRFLPAQYLGMIKDEWKHSAWTAINRRYGYMYSIEWLLKEVDKLAFLAKVDPVAFEERKQFLLPSDIYYIASDYVEKLETEINSRLALQVYKVAKKGKVYLKFHGYKEIYAGNQIEIIKDHKIATEVEKSDELMFLVLKFKEMVKQLKEVCALWRAFKNKDTYKKINQILQGIRFIELPYNTKKSNVFLDRFMAQGAFYTLRNLILFEDYRLKGRKNREAEELLRASICLDGYKLHAMLKECLKDNNHPDFMD